MIWKNIFVVACCVCALSSGNVSAAESFPMKQGMHEWTAFGGKLMLVVGTYQDSTTFRHSYTFYFKDTKDEAWNQVPVRNKRGLPQFEWDSANGAEITLADGIVSHRSDGVYFIVADKRADQGYQQRGDITVTWYELKESDDNHPDDPAYQFTSAFVRTYSHSALTVETVLSREVSLQPHQ